jgi:DNA (cytosine-5)-methyltransferase 1
MVTESTFIAHYAKDLSTRLVADARFPRGVRPYTVREYARLQGVPDAFSLVGSEAHAYRMIGNGISVPVENGLGLRLEGISAKRLSGENTSTDFTDYTDR